MNHNVETRLRHHAQTIACGIGAIALLLPLGTATAAIAQGHPAVESRSAELSHSSNPLLAQFGGIRIPGSGSDESEEPGEPAEAENFSGFSSPGCSIILE